MFVFLKHDNYYKTQSWNVLVALRAVWWEMLLHIWKEWNKASVQCLIYNQKGERSFRMGATSTWGKRWMLPKNSSQTDDDIAYGSPGTGQHLLLWSQMRVEASPWSYSMMLWSETLSFEFFLWILWEFPVLYFDHIAPSQAPPRTTCLLP